MKLKKIASLVLAGVMAVSMLAGCQNANVEPEQPGEPETPASSAAVDTLYSELTGSAKVKVTPVANNELDAALAEVVDKYWDYDSEVDYKYGLWNVVGYDHLTDVRYKGRIGEALKVAVGADYIDMSDNSDGFSDAKDANDRSVVEVYAINASTSDEYALELLAEKIDEAVSNLPSEGGYDKFNMAKANYDYTYTISASVETKTVTFAGVEYGIKYVAVMLDKTATEKA